MLEILKSMGGTAVVTVAFVAVVEDWGSLFRTKSGGGPKVAKGVSEDCVSLANGSRGE